MKIIPLTLGYSAIVDDADHAAVSQWNWRALVRKSSFSTRVYAVRFERGTKRTIMLHRELSNAPVGMVVDHINGNGLDNRRDNIRVCTHSQNLANQSIKGTSQSRLKGVARFRNKWKVTITSNGKVYYLGVYTDPISGALAYDEAAIRLHGEFARLNFPRVARSAA